MTSESLFAGWPTILTQLLLRRDLTAEIAHDAITEILSGRATPAQISAFVVALRAKGETAHELQGMLQAVRNEGLHVKLAPEVAEHAIDIVGTGGDHSNSVNVSTMAALVVAGAGAVVCKHGSHASSSACGSADFLQELGVAINLDASGVESCIARTRIGFCLAPRFHPAFRHAGPARREIGIPTAFNLLGPMANPAPISNMLVGVANESMMDAMAKALESRGVSHAWIVHGDGGLDELSLSGINSIVQVRNGKMSHFTLKAKDFGVTPAGIEAIRGGDAAVNASICRDMLSGEKGPVRDIVSFNAGAALYIVGLVSDLSDGIARAHASIDSGAASDTLDGLIDESVAQYKKATQ